MLQQRFQRAALAVIRKRCIVGTSIPKTQRSLVSMTRPLWEKHSVAVPTMGDSITEGTVVEWAVAVGQAVKTDDVVALVETDKVTVDIKAEMDGVITQQFAAVDENVEVGAPLYELDTEAEATVTAAETTESAAAAEPAKEETVVAAKEESAPQQQTQQTQQSQPQQQHRVPMIKFLGKDGWERVLSGKPAEPDVPATTPASPLAISVADSSMIHPMYGRPHFSEEEMETLMLGGADQAPTILGHSSVTKFKHAG